MLIGGLGMIWSPYVNFCGGGLTNWPSHGILRAKTAEPQRVSNTNRYFL